MDVGQEWQRAGPRECLLPEGAEEARREARQARERPRRLRQGVQDHGQEAAVVRPGRRSTSPLPRDPGRHRLQHLPGALPAGQRAERRGLPQEVRRLAGLRRLDVGEAQRRAGHRQGLLPERPADRRGAEEEAQPRRQVRAGVRVPAICVQENHDFEHHHLHYTQDDNGVEHHCHSPQYHQQEQHHPQQQHCHQSQQRQHYPHDVHTGDHHQGTLPTWIALLLRSHAAHWI
mmetsp:Transcript_52293/g.144854  ORF Transcript_52293/g.144854 Transcript_52293/m.144854 type:complete len:231 (+) Transcript_52293:894-1586(+)